LDGDTVDRKPLFDRHNSESIALTKSPSRVVPPGNTHQVHFDQTESATAFVGREQNSIVFSSTASKQTSTSYFNEDEYYLNPEYYGKGKQRASIVVPDTLDYSSITRGSNVLSDVPTINITP